MRVQSFIRQLPFTHPFTISKGTKTHQPTFVVELDFNGIKGYGEAPAIAYYNIPVEKMQSDLDAKKKFVEKFAFTDPERYWHYLHHLYPANGFLVCALDIAAWDLFGKLKRQPLFKMFGADPVHMPITDYTIGIDTTEKMIAKMQETPWPVYKIKLGTDRDMEIMESLRRHTDTPLRIDANAAWTKEEALEKINAFASMNVEFIEQPLAKDDWEGMAWLYERSPLPLVADESCVFEQDVAHCEGHFHGINIKLTKCTGITPALRMIKDARARGMKIMLGCMNESTIGSAALAHLAPLADWLDMDGPLLLAEDLASGLHYNFGKVSLPESPGLGISVHL
ncbi:dipeptide epimerase [Flavihumibacter stibioxidans]|uniref:Dipeptide epimerase n=1 Tax=Flavihumibacter stibioxidans TaxID=1834163 RepID=A0ABR7M382_9BACT|nr:dipeptide epimerase [Flavihumibacter stibioxidans]MBC6489477.1 dipeptide epimerase [Flavihumibacter stibioxidans]